jgi:hypothetical protein
VASPDARYDLAVALYRSNRRDEARKELAEFLRVVRVAASLKMEKEGVARAMKRLQEWR